MRKQDLVLNFLLALSAGALAWKLHADWRDYAAKNGPQALKVHNLTGVSLPPLAPAPDYTAVARQNPFHPERNDIIQLPEAQAKPVGPPPLIYGSVILGESRYALMATEESPKPERVPEGGTFRGYHLVKVSPESVVLESAGGRDEIMLYNALMRLHRQTTKTVASSASRPSTPTAVSSTVSSPPSSQTDVANSGPVNSPPAPATPSTPALSVPAGKEIRQTPFGPILVDKKKP